ncbi:MAG TPA: exodeoxyribonuclease VII small subunit [Candidatus Saccharibacteria bacterium]|nr:exodeoxyribonuclease VII small subunit [Candidatus Saccharibacteria bacterium]HMT39320.1 exodeoxyribonuclease VII small subunit [Candidatus Saccharibacteria bacterium]
MTKVNNSKVSKDFDFASAMKELTEITQYLENSDVDLDNAVEKFKRGSELARNLKKYLEETENTIQTIKADF